MLSGWSSVTYAEFHHEALFFSFQGFFRIVQGLNMQDLKTLAMMFWCIWLR
jgi:hypothetical protein